MNTGLFNTLVDALSRLVKFGLTEEHGPEESRSVYLFAQLSSSSNVKVPSSDVFSKSKICIYLMNMTLKPPYLSLLTMDRQIKSIS